MPGMFAGMAPAQRQARATQLLAALGLENRSRHRPTALSGGEQQRVSIARALMNGGRVILADEPTGALDRKNSRQVLDLLDMLAGRGHTVILVTHNTEVASRADRLIELLDGRIVADSGSHPRIQSLSPTDRLPVPKPAFLSAAMRWGERCRSAALALRTGLWTTRRARTVLTVLSIVLGVWAVGTMLSIAEGVYRQTLAQVGRLSADRIHVVPSKHPIDSTIALSLEDAREIAQRVPNVRRTTSAFAEKHIVSHGTNSLEVTVESYASFLPLDGKNYDAPRMERGQFITPANNRSRDQVAVIGWEIEETFFPTGIDALGQYVTIGNLPFRVTGVLSNITNIEEAPRWYGGKPGRRVVIPFATSAVLLRGTTVPQSLDVFVQDPLRIASTGHAIRQLLIRRHSSEGFSVSYPGERVAQLSEMRGLLWLGLSAVGSIALLAGGLGVMAVMLMAVSERKREIAIRMALGARRRDITLQFILEAALLTSAGGVLGLATSAAATPLVESFGVPVAFSSTVAVAAVASAVVTGFVFGISPARRASTIEPATALATAD